MLYSLPRLVNAVYYLPSSTMPTKAAVNILLLPNVLVPSNNDDNNAGHGSKKLGGYFVNKNLFDGSNDGGDVSGENRGGDAIRPSTILEWLNYVVQLN